MISRRVTEGAILAEMTARTESTALASANPLWLTTSALVQVAPEVQENEDGHSLRFQ